MLRLALVMLTLACSTRVATPPGEPSDDQLLALGDRVLAMQDEMARAAAAAGSDCGRMATAVTGVVNAHRDLLAPELAARMRRYDARFDRVMTAQRSQRYTEIMGRFRDAIAPCAGDSRLTAALAPLDVASGSATP